MCSGAASMDNEMVIGLICVCVLSLACLAMGGAL